MKVVFCFMTYEDIVHIDVWRSFFSDASENSFSVYIHSKQRILTSGLAGSIIIPTQPTAWGKFSLVEVQQALFCKAYNDPANYKFILLSGDSVPLYSFATIYARLTSDDKGYMSFTKGAHKASREKFANKAAWLPRDTWEWYGSSQWCILNRNHIELLIRHWPMLVATFSSSKLFASDEHVYPIFFNAYNQKNTFLPEVMYVDWSPSMACSIAHRTIPKTFHTEDLVERTVNTVYASGSLFLRKLCVHTTLVYDWTKARPLQPSPQRKNTIVTIKLQGVSRAKAGAR